MATTGTRARWRQCYWWGCVWWALGAWAAAGPPPESLWYQVQSVVASTSAAPASPNEALEEVRVLVRSQGCRAVVCQVYVTYESVARNATLGFELAVPHPYVEYGTAELLGFTPSWTKQVSAVVSLTDDFGSGLLARSVADFLGGSQQPLGEQQPVVGPGSGAGGLSEAPPPVPPFVYNTSGTEQVLTLADKVLQNDSEYWASLVSNATGAPPVAGRRRQRRRLAQALLDQGALSQVKATCQEFAHDWKSLRESSLRALKKLNGTELSADDQAALNADYVQVQSNCLAQTVTAVSSKCLDLAECAKQELQNVKYNLDLKLASAYTTELLFLRNAYTRQLDAFSAGNDFWAQWTTALAAYESAGAVAQNASKEIAALLAKVSNTTSELEDALAHMSAFYVESLGEEQELVARSSRTAANVLELVAAAAGAAEELTYLLEPLAYGVELLTDRNRLYMLSLLEKAVGASSVWGSLSRMLELIHTRAETKASLVRTLFAGLDESHQQGWWPLVLDAGAAAVDLVDPATGTARWFGAEGSAWSLLRIAEDGGAGCPGAPAGAYLERHTLALTCNSVQLSFAQYSYDSVLHLALLFGPDGCGNQTCTCALVHTRERTAHDPFRQQWVALHAAAFAGALGANQSAAVNASALPVQARGEGPFLSPPEEDWYTCPAAGDDVWWGLAAVQRGLRALFCDDGGEGGWLVQGYCGRAPVDSAAWELAGVADAASLVAALDRACAAAGAGGGAGGGAGSAGVLGADVLGLWVERRSGRLARQLTWPFLDRVRAGLPPNSTFGEITRALLGRDVCLVTPGGYRAWAGAGGGSALGALRLANRDPNATAGLAAWLAGTAGPAADELAETHHPAQQLWEDVLAVTPRLVRQGAKLRQAAQGRLPTPTATETRRGRQERRFGVRGQRDSVTLNGAGLPPDTNATVRLQMLEDVATAVMVSPDLSEVWLLGDRRERASAAVAGAEVLGVSWHDPHGLLLGAQQYFLGYPRCLDTPCPFRATRVDPETGLVTEYRDTSGGGGGPGTGAEANSTHPFGTAYSDSPGLTPYVIDVPTRLLTVSRAFRARAGTPLYLFQPVPAGAEGGGGGTGRAAQWLAMGDQWFAELTPPQRADYLGQWGALVRLPLRRDGAARLLDSRRNPFAQGKFDPREAVVSAGHFAAELAVPAPKSAAELLEALRARQELPPESLAALQWRESLVPPATRGLDLRQLDRRCRRTATAQAGGWCLILQHYFLHWSAETDSVRLYPRDWELELTVRRSVPWEQAAANATAAAAPPRERDPHYVCPDTFDLAALPGGSRSLARLAYDREPAARACTLVVRVEGCAPAAVPVADLAPYQTYELDLSACAVPGGAGSLWLVCPDYEVLCADGLALAPASVPLSLQQARDNARTIRVEQQSELAGLYRQLGEMLSSLSVFPTGPGVVAGLIDVAELDAAARDSLQAYSLADVSVQRALTYLTGVQLAANNSAQQIIDRAGDWDDEYAALLIQAANRSAELIRRQNALRLLQAELAGLYDEGLKLWAKLPWLQAQLNEAMRNTTGAMYAELQRLQHLLDLYYSLPPGLEPGDLALLFNLSYDECFYVLPPLPAAPDAWPDSARTGSLFLFGFHGPRQWRGGLLLGLTVGLTASAVAWAVIWAVDLARGGRCGSRPRRPGRRGPESKELLGSKEFKAQAQQSHRRSQRGCGGCGCYDEPRQRWWWAGVLGTHGLLVTVCWLALALSHVHRARRDAAGWQAGR